MQLQCVQCNKIEYEPFDVGDVCTCGGKFELWEMEEETFKEKIPAIEFNMGLMSNEQRLALIEHLKKCFCYTCGRSLHLGPKCDCDLKN